MTELKHRKLNVTGLMQVRYPPVARMGSDFFSFSASPVGQNGYHRIKVALTALYDDQPHVTDEVFRALAMLREGDIVRIVGQVCRDKKKTDDGSAAWATCIRLTHAEVVDPVETAPYPAVEGDVLVTSSEPDNEGGAFFRTKGLIVVAPEGGPCPEKGSHVKVAGSLGKYCTENEDGSQTWDGLVYADSVEVLAKGVSTGGGNRGKFAVSKKAGQGGMRASGPVTGMPQYAEGPPPMQAFTRPASPEPTNAPLRMPAFTRSAATQAPDADMPF